jgi:hypothetical protein
MNHRKEAILGELSQNNRKQEAWRNLRNDETFQTLIAYLEKRYIEIANKDCNSIADVKARNFTMQFIRDIFVFMQGDLDTRRQLKAELDAILEQDGVLEVGGSPFDGINIGGM